MASVGSSAAFSGRTRRSLTTSWVRAAAPCGIGALLVVGSVLATRRMAGAFSDHLLTLMLLVTIVLTALVIFGGRIAWRLTSAPRRREQLQFREQLVGWGGTLALALMFLGCSFPALSYWNWLFWLPLIVVDYLQRDWFFESAPLHWTPRVIEHEAGLAGRSSWPPPRPTPKPSPVLPLTPIRLTESESASVAETLDDNVLQQLTRIRDETGVESVFGVIRAEFAADQRHATVHIGFCPPLAGVPTVEADPADGPDATIKVLQSFAHGARLEVRLAESAAEACSVLLEITAK